MNNFNTQSVTSTSATSAKTLMAHAIMRRSMQKCGPFGVAFALAEHKALVGFDERGLVSAIRDHDDDDIKVAQIPHHDRERRDAHDLLYRALVALGYSERNGDR
jgi:hypothetical protein